MRRFWRRHAKDRPEFDLHVLRHGRSNGSRWEMVGLVFTAVGTIAAVVGTIIALWPGSDGHAPAPGASALTVEEAVVHNGAARYAMDESKDRQTLASSPGIDVTVLNRGTRRALVTGARVEILDWAELPVCYTEPHTGGQIPYSARSTIHLPTNPPRPGRRTIERPLHQQIAAGDVDRFLLRFALDDRTFDVDQLVVLRLRLSVDGGGTLDAGKFLVSLPEVMGTYVERFPLDDQLAGVRRKRWTGLSATWCYRHNLEVAKRLLGSDAERSQEMEAVGPLTPAAGWVRDRDRTPARQAVDELLRGYDPAGLRLAIYAAQQTGDRALVERTTVAAAQRMLHIAELHLDNGALAVATASARASLALRDTPRAQALLARAMARQRDDRGAQ